MIEHKIGEVFEDKGKRLQCVECLDCNGCYFTDLPYCIGGCSPSHRKDRKSIIFKEIKDMEQKEVKISIPEGYEIDNEKSSFERIIFKKKEKEIKKWIDLVGNTMPLGSCYIEDGGCIFPSRGKFNVCSVNIFIDERHAKSALAMAQIIQLIPYYGGAITDEEWGNENLDKYTIKRIGNEIEFGVTRYTYSFLSFHTSEQRNSFYENNEQLVKDYLMIE